MNQILQNENLNENINSKFKKRKKVLFFRLQLILSAIIAICLLTFYLYTYYVNKKNESLSSILLSNYDISLLYSTTENKYSSDINITSAYTDTDNKYFVIGVIQIDKIKVTYPILSETSEELLKISTCRFFGPNANEVR